MSQATCPQCHAPFTPGQRFCPNCGKQISSTGEGVIPTVAASNSSLPPTMAANSNEGLPPTMAAGSNPNLPPVGNSNPNLPPTMAAEDPANHQQPYSQYASGAYTPPPPPSYNGYPGGTPTPNDPYAPPPPPGPGMYSMPPIPPKKKNSLPWIIGAVVVVLVLAVCGGSLYGITQLFSKKSTDNKTQTTTDNNNNGDNSNDTATKSVTLTNLAISYATDQITFTSIEQADQFPDDTYTKTYSYEKKSNFVRIHMKEKQEGGRSAYFSYSSAFSLILPDKTTIKALNAGEFSGPKEGEQRENWVDFETKKPVDLNSLVLRLGTAEEAQMEFPLKSNADLSEYLPKQADLNKAFNYGPMKWTLNTAIQRYDAPGSQAKKGKVFVIVSLTASNPSSSDFWGYDYIRLKSGDTTAAPEYTSDDDDLNDLSAGASNVKGTLIFQVPPSDTYTLVFASGKNLSGTNVTFSIK